MATLNKVMLIGRLTRDPEFRAFGGGGRVAKIGLAVNNRKKDASGNWVDDPVFLDCEAFNRGEHGKQADLIEKFGLRKGSPLFVEGRLVLDSWDDKQSGQKRTKIKVVIDNFQILESKRDGGDSNAGRADVPRSYAGPSNDLEPAGGDIPF